MARVFYTFIAAAFFFGGCGSSSDTNTQDAEVYRINDPLVTYDETLWLKSDGWGNGGVFANEWQASQITFADSIMLISLEKVNDILVSGEYRSVDTYGHAKYEISLKASNIPGTVSGFFTYTGPSEGTVHDEIDIEIKGDDPTKLQVNYWSDGVEHPTDVDLGFDASQEYHTYGFSWQAQKIEWFVDGISVHTEDGSRGALPTHAGYVMVNLWGSVNAQPWSSDFNTSMQASLFVDAISVKE